MKFAILVRVLVTVIAFYLGAGSIARAADAPWPAASPDAIKRWQDMRFGMFIHWGPVTLKGTEIGWSRGTKAVPTEVYDNLYKSFDPEKFNADEWAANAKAAGMKYLVLTCKHHDGFCLWDTKYTDYNIMHTSFKRDVVKELSAENRDAVDTIVKLELDGSAMDIPAMKVAPATTQPR